MDRDKAVELVELVRQRCTNFFIKEEYEIEEFVEGSTNSCSIFIERIDDRSRYWFRFTDWDKGDEYCRLSIGHHRKSDSILELIEVDDENSPPTLNWTYTPKKRKDGRNKERKERFIALTGSLTQRSHCQKIIARWMILLEKSSPWSKIEIGARLGRQRDRRARCRGG